MAVNEHLFPDLSRTGYQLTSPPDPVYNCIAWAAGQTNAWWWPDPDGFDYWPPGVVRERTLAAFIQAFATVGYAPCSDDTLESGWEKAAIYATDEGPTHAARQLPNGRWTSKWDRMMTLTTPLMDYAAPYMARWCSSFDDQGVHHD